MYSYSPFLRVTPPGGAQVTFDLAAISTMQVCQWTPEMIVNQKETVRRRIRNIRYGWRLHASFTWIVDPGGASETTLVNLGFYINRNAHLLELSMDGGTTYRECLIVPGGWVRTNIE